MRKAYSEMMDRIVVTGQMRERILNRVQSENLEGQLSEKTCWQKYRKYFAAAACLAVFAAGTVTWNYTNSGDQPAQPSGGAAGESSHAGGSTSGEEITGSGLSGDGQSEAGRLVRASWMPVHRANICLAVTYLGMGCPAVLNQMASQIVKHPGNIHPAAIHLEAASRTGASL